MDGIATVPDDELLPLSALNDFLFCTRRCALHRLEQVWADNLFTIDGTLAHRRVDIDGLREESKSGVRVVRGMRLRSDRLRLIGVADVVEFGDSPLPVEYKRGRRRRWDNDDVQLCAQALCLEEMLGVRVPQGAIFHRLTKRRREVAFTEELRRLTEDTAARLHRLVADGAVPAPIYRPRCRGCSVKEQCFPKLLEAPRRIEAYLSQLYQASASNPD